MSCILCTSCTGKPSSLEGEYVNFPEDGTASFRVVSKENAYEGSFSRKREGNIEWSRPVLLKECTNEDLKRLLGDAVLDSIGSSYGLCSQDDSVTIIRHKRHASIPAAKFRRDLLLVAAAPIPGLFDIGLSQNVPHGVSLDMKTDYLLFSTERLFFGQFDDESVENHPILSNVYKKR